MRAGLTMMALLASLVLAPTAAAGERLAAGMSHTCAIDTAGAISCWGDNSKSQLNGVPADGPFMSVTAGENHTCAIRTTGTLACWGDNVYKQTTDVPTGTFTFVDSAYRHTCALGTAGKVACWGDNSFSQISGVPTGTDFKALSVGMGGSCALKRDDDTAVCFGGLYWNPNFPLPNGAFDVVDAGGFSACGIRSRHRTLACWGNNQMNEQNDVPTGEFTAMDSHVTHSCAIRVDGSLACWGNNSGGQRNGMPTEGTFVVVSVGYIHSCAMRVDGTVKCWGGTYVGQDLTLVPADLAFSDIAAGGSSSCGVKADRALFCWGTGADGSVPAPPAGSFGDITAPVVEPVVTGRQGSSGWYVDDVAVTWNVTDAETPILSRPGCDPTTIAADTAATELTCVATAAEATKSTLTIRRDTLVPTLTCSDSLGADGTVTASVADATSGPLAATITAPSEITPTGTRRATLVGTDLAGHTAAITCSYRETTLTAATPATPPAPPAPVAKCESRAAIAAAIKSALGRGITIRRASIRLGSTAATKLKTNRRRTQVTLPLVLKAGAVRIAVTYRKGTRTRTLRRTFDAC